MSSASSILGANLPQQQLQQQHKQQQQQHPLSAKQLQKRHWKEHKSHELAHFQPKHEQTGVKIDQDVHKKQRVWYNVFLNNRTGVGSRAEDSW